MHICVCSDVGSSCYRVGAPAHSYHSHFPSFHLITFFAVLYCSLLAFCVLFCLVFFFFHFNVLRHTRCNAKIATVRRAYTVAWPHKMPHSACLWECHRAEHRRFFFLRRYSTCFLTKLLRNRRSPSFTYSFFQPASWLLIAIEQPKISSR